jgi:hypothetical protein
MDRVSCHRCQGLMHPISPLDPLDTLKHDGREQICAWWCLTCGNLVDPVILQNRLRLRSSRHIRQRNTPRHPVFKAPD